MMDIGGWSSKLVFLGSRSLTNLLFPMVSFLLPSTLITCCSCGLIPTMSILAFGMISNVHSMVYLTVASFSLITSSVVLASKLFPHCLGQDIVPPNPMLVTAVFTNPTSGNSEFSPN